MLNPIRAALGARGKRRKKKRASAFPIAFEGNNVSEDIPLERYPLSLTMPVFERPGFLVGRKRANDEPMLDKVWTWFAPDAEAQAQRLIQERGVSKLEITHQLHIPEFIKFLAKVAHSFAVAERVKFQPVLTNLIRSPRDAAVKDALHYIGIAEEPAGGFPLYEPGQGGHRLAQMTYSNKNDTSFTFFSVHIQFFRILRSPTYEVIIGSIGATI